MEVIKENYKLYQGDCLELLKNIPNKSINLVLIDPPYNIGKDKWDKWVDEWCVIPIQSLAFFGKFTRIFTNLVKRILQYMYRVVNHSYFKLSNSRVTKFYK